MVAKLVRLATYKKELSPKNMHDSSMRWSTKDTWQIKQLISTLTETPRTPS